MVKKSKRSLVKSSKKTNHSTKKIVKKSQPMPVAPVSEEQSELQKLEKIRQEAKTDEEALASQKVVDEAKQKKRRQKFYCTNAELLAELIKWRDSDPDPEKRVMSEELGKMFIELAKKLTNHSCFRNYNWDMKQELMSYGLYKLVKGIKNYNFKFTNAFAYCTSALFNSYRTVCSSHYKYINIKREALQEYMTEIECEMPNSSMLKSLKNQFNIDFGEGGNDE